MICEYILSCRLERKPNEIAPDIYWYAGTNEDGVAKFDTRREEAERVVGLQRAMLLRETLLSRGLIMSCVIESPVGLPSRCCQ